MDDRKELVSKIAKLSRDNKENEQELAKLKERIEELNAHNSNLQNVIAQLPPELIPEEATNLLNTQTLRFNMATVLYVDIQGLKRIAEGMDANDAIDALDQIFLDFTEICEKHKLEKIKTVGDAFMCAGGIPIRNITNPIDVVLAALEMRFYVQELKEKYKEKNLPFWDFRFGIHTGPVTANVRGKKKISYDLKGEGVNIATRMATSTGDETINVSSGTYELVRGYFSCNESGSIPVKYHGDLAMYHVRKIKPAYSIDRKLGVFPNEIFKIRYLLRQLIDLEHIVFNRLENELPNYLYYHNLRHTIDVVNQAEVIGYCEGVDDEAILILKTAALFHDIGHIIGYDDHEYLGTQIVREMLPKYNYSQDQIERICTIIMATKMPPNPQSLLEKIICDSDLDYLGRRDFVPISDALYKELKEQNKIGSYNDWNKLQIMFLEKHQFFTETSNKLRSVNKKQQIDRIKSLIVPEEGK